MQQVTYSNAYWFMAHWFTNISNHCFCWVMAVLIFAMTFKYAHSQLAGLTLMTHSKISASFDLNWLPYCSDCHLFLEYSSNIVHRILQRASEPVHPSLRYLLISSLEHSLFVIVCDLSVQLFRSFHQPRFDFIEQDLYFNPTEYFTDWSGERSPFIQSEFRSEHRPRL